MFNKVNDTLNKSVNEETTLINSLPLGKYFLIYIPILFVIFSFMMFIEILFFEFPFDIRHVIIQAVSFAVFFTNFS
jgi:hypothetical protein